jgi:hypothetical protein
MDVVVWLRSLGAVFRQNDIDETVPEPDGGTRCAVGGMQTGGCAAMHYDALCRIAPTNRSALLSCGEDWWIALIQFLLPFCRHEFEELPTFRRFPRQPGGARADHAGGKQYP